MKKASIIFDSRDIFFKRPQGAVKADTEMRFRLLVAEEIAPTSVQLIVKYDRHDMPAVYGMNRSGEVSPRAQGYLEFSADFRIHDTGLYWYHFRVETEGDAFLIGRDPSNNAMISHEPAAWQQTVYKPAYAAPEWIYGGIYYHIFVDRFNRSGRPRVEMEGKVTRTDWGALPQWRPQKGKILNNDFFGGDLEGIRQKLPYLAELHVSCIYLSPIFEAYSNHKYDTGDYEHIDPMFGSDEDFRKLCTAAEEYGIRIVCDGVFAHTGSDSRYFDRYGHYAAQAREAADSGAYENPDSKYRNWYCFHEDGSYDCWWDFPTLPKVNKRDPGYMEYITGNNGIARRWLRAGAWGWRLDVADELPNDFLDALTRAVKEEKEDAIVIGEVWEDASSKIAYDERKNYFEGKRLDSVMNYPFRSAIIDFVRYGDAGSIARTVETIVENYPPEVVHCLMNVLGTHDSLRIITALAGEDLGTDPPRDIQAETRMNEEQWKQGIRLLKIASLLQMTLPGVPCIYYGDEAGIEGYKDPFNRTCYPWGRENGELLEWYKKITGLRTENRVYVRGGYRTLAAAEGFFAFERFDSHGSLPSLITAANCGEEEKHLPLEGEWVDLLRGDICSGTIAVFPDNGLLLRKT